MSKDKRSLIRNRKTKKEEREWTRNEMMIKV